MAELNEHYDVVIVGGAMMGSPSVEVKLPTGFVRSGLIHNTKHWLSE